MKTGILLLLTMIAVSVTAADSNWHQMPTGYTGIINSVYFCGQNSGFGVTTDGLIIRISDNGQAVIDTLKQNLPLQSICFLPECKKGFICGSKGMLFKTENGGQSWVPQSFDSSFWFFDIGFVDSLHGLMVGSNVYSEYSMAGVAFITSDGGRNWDSVTIKGRQLDNIDISPEGIMTVAGAGRIFISRDSGHTWEDHNSPEGGAVRAAGIRGNIGLMVGMNGYVAMSGDAGKTWQKYAVLSEDKHLMDLVMVDSRRAYAAGSDGAILYTDDSGRNWTPEASSTNAELIKLRQFGNRLYGCGGQGKVIYKDWGKK